MKTKKNLPRSELTPLKLKQLKNKDSIKLKNFMCHACATYASYIYLDSE